ncbi:DUF4194 domain-containing protein [Alkalilimnicola sp. S0819]|uniref:DUF4194 domain-containing protein n=1 Tax=Alkalilimnicola sp. S0819 TaxID=2613922 RepID=UPI001261BBFC|nr:DUF4194 domain-containing protein [Alkalilimnicola sp. S0819]KAB7624111.1 DUF4194 domain-containing protein [Alkalilimnicola sp. S0819]MPQ16363.1 DUF4194 domain-containing protein [Alkalilimnicola sp. S0819]
MTEETTDDRLSTVLIALFKGVLYQDQAPETWQGLLDLQARVRDYVAVLGLELNLDEAEGYAYLGQRREDADGAALPRLVPRRALSYPVSLLLALLRKKLAEHDAGGGDPRLILAREQIVELMRVFLPESANEAKLVDRIDSHINKAVELGFLRRLRGQPDQLEVRRILKAYVDAQWLSEFQDRLAEYRAHAGEGG